MLHFSWRKHQTYHRSVSLKEFVSHVPMPTAAELALQKKYAELRAKKQKVMTCLVHTCSRLDTSSPKSVRCRRLKPKLHQYTNRRRSKLMVISKVQEVADASVHLSAQLSSTTLHLPASIRSDGEVQAFAEFAAGQAAASFSQTRSQGNTRLHTYDACSLIDVTGNDKPFKASPLCLAADHSQNHWHKASR